MEQKTFNRNEFEVTLPFSKHEYEQRWAAAFAEMRLRNLQFAVVWSKGGGTFERFQDAYYLTNYYSCNSGFIYDWMAKDTRAAAHCAVILQLDKEPILVADDPSLDRNGIATSNIVAQTDVVDALASTLKKEGITGLVGLIGTDCITARHMTALSELTPQITWREEDDLILDIRIVKSAAELDLIRVAGDTVTSAMNAMFKTIFSGGSEADAAAEAAKVVYQRQGNIHFCHVGYGPWMAERITTDPMAGYSTRTPPDGELVRGWLYGAMHKGYWLDPGRTTVVGLRPTSEQRRLVEGCAELVENLRLMIKPGVSVVDVAIYGEEQRQKFYGGKSQTDDWFSVLGHGNGLFFEPPVISTEYDGKHKIYREGMVVATEAFLTIPGVGTAGFEQNSIVTKNGTELLTKTPMIWW